MTPTKRFMFIRQDGFVRIEPAGFLRHDQYRVSFDEIPPLELPYVGVATLRPPVFSRRDFTFRGSAGPYNVYEEV